MAENSTLARSRRVLASLSDDQRVLFDKAFDAAVAAGDYDPAGFAAKGIIESNYNPTVVNSGGFTGLFQIGTRGKATPMADLVQANLMTKAEADRINLKNPDDNIKVALLYRKRLFDMLGNGVAADIAFNAGPTILRKAMKKTDARDAVSLAKAMAKINPKSYGSDRKIKEVSEYQPAISSLSQDVNSDRSSRGLSIKGVPGEVPPHALGATQLPGQGVQPPAGVNPPPQPPSSLTQDPLSGATGPQPIGLPDLKNTSRGLVQTPTAATGEESVGRGRIPLPTEAPDLRSALQQMTGGGLSYNIPLGGPFDRQAKQGPTSSLDIFLDTLLDRA